jgi:signal transduction histidine kinase/FixJ family two-component response regulator
MTACDSRALVLAPVGRDARMAAAQLAAEGIAATTCRTIDELVAELRAGAGAAIVTEEALLPRATDGLLEHLAHEPPWSDFPFVLLTSGGDTTRASLRLVSSLGPAANVTLLERPVRALTLVHAVRAALRARRRQYEVRDHLATLQREIEVRRRAERAREESLALAERARAEAEAFAETMRRVETITEPALVADLPFDELIRELLARVCHTLDGDAAVILLRTVEDGEVVLRVRAALGLDEALQREVRVPVGHGFAGRIAAERQPLVADALDDDTEDVSPYIRRKGIRSLAGVPLLTDDGLLGVLHVGSVERRRFRADEVELLQMAAERIASAIERAARRDVERQARQAAEAANRAKDEFLALLSHELRNPLAAMMHAVVIARLDEAHRDQALDIARRQAQHLTRLVDDLLDVARITQGRISLCREPVALAQVVARAIEATRPTMEDREHHVTVSVPAEVVTVHGDPVRLEQIATNLLTNAAKYTGPGGHIDVMVAREGDAAVLRVRDDGMGVTPDLMPRIFDIFAQGERTLDRSEGGLGVGLSVVKQLVELHGGRVEVRSAGRGAGSEFVVRLPALATAPEPRSLAAPAAGRPRHARVLVVEDNPDASDALYMLLELLGHTVRVVRDGPAALDAVRTAVPDVALVDIGLPGMDGYEVARRARPLAEPGRMTLVALTGYGRDEDKERALAAGFDYHLTKPVDIDALRALLASAASDERTSIAS